VFPTWIAITSGQVRVEHVFCVRLLIIPTANGNTPARTRPATVGLSLNPSKMSRPRNGEAAGPDRVIFRFIIDVAGHRKKTWAEDWGLGNALALFNPRPITQELDFESQSQNQRQSQRRRTRVSAPH
jgi:hypothetical protein